MNVTVKERPVTAVRRIYGLLFDIPSKLFLICASVGPHTANGILELNAERVLSDVRCGIFSRNFYKSRKVFRQT